MLLRRNYRSSRFRRYSLPLKLSRHPSAVCIFMKLPRTATARSSVRRPHFAFRYSSKRARGNNAITRLLRFQSEATTASSLANFARFHSAIDQSTRFSGNEHHFRIESLGVDDEEAMLEERRRTIFGAKESRGGSLLLLLLLLLLHKSFVHIFVIFF